MTRSLLLSLTIIAMGCMTAAPAMAQFGQGNSSNNLFQQYDVAGVGMYPAPYYSPQLGAQSYYAYQPLMPHEMMYQHSRNYFNYYNTGGYYGGGYDSLNKTSVRWQSGTNHIGPLPFTRGLENARYRVNSRLYGLDGGGGGLQLRGGGHGLRQGHLRGHFHGAGIGHGLHRGGCSTGTCDSGEIISEEVVGEQFVGEAVVSDGACSSGGCASRLRGALHR